MIRKCLFGAILPLSISSCLIVVTTISLEIKRKAMSENLPKEHNNKKLVFCYGDSLTTVTSPPNMQVFPYASGVCCSSVPCAVCQNMSLKHALRSPERTVA